MPTTTNLSTLKINYLTQAQYDAAVSNNTINENEIYLTPSPAVIPITAGGTGATTAADARTNLGLSTAMLFIGTLGAAADSPTTTSLPTASNSQGYTYKVITNGTYAGQAAKAGDVFVSNGVDWVYIPSGDEPSGTVTNVAASGTGGITISGSPITTSGTLTIGLNLSTAINGLGEGTSAAQRNDYVVAQYAGGGSSNTTYYRRKVSNILAAMTSSDVTTALGYTPYNATNPNGYTSNTGTVTSITAGAGLNTTSADTGTDGGNITASGTLYLTKSGVTANTYGNTSQQTPSHGGTFNIPYFTVDKYGRITSANTTTVKLPADNNTDTKVTQGTTTTASWRKLLLNGGSSNVQSAWNTAITETTDQVYQSQYIAVQPSTGTLAAKQLMVAGAVTLQYNTTTEALDFIFM